MVTLNITLKKSCAFFFLLISTKFNNQKHFMVYVINSQSTTRIQIKFKLTSNCILISRQMFILIIFILMSRNSFILVNTKVMMNTSLELPVIPLCVKQGLQIFFFFFWEESKGYNLVIEINDQRALTLFGFHFLLLRNRIVSPSFTVGEVKMDTTRELDTTRHDTKLAGYGLRLNGFVSYSGWHGWTI